MTIEAMKPLEPLQRFTVSCAVAAGLTVFVLAVHWANHSTDEVHSNGYLGGLNWSDKIFNCHVVCMIGFIVCFSYAILSFRLLPLGKPNNVCFIFNTCVKIKL